MSKLNIVEEKILIPSLKFIFTIFCAAFAMEAIGTYISVIGLGSLFAGDPVILALAVILDVAKIVSVSFLYQYWAGVKPAMKYYLLVASIVLMTITSAGAFGYLSGAFQKAIQPNMEVSLKVDSYKAEQAQLVAEKEQLKAERINIDKQIASLPGDDVDGRRSLIRSFKPESVRISERLGVVTKRVDELNAQVLKVESESIDTRVHAGPITYISKAFGISLEDASKWIILTIIFVFDPLAVILLLSGNFLVKTRKDMIALIPEKVEAEIEESFWVPRSKTPISEAEVIKQVADECIAEAEQIASSDPNLKVEWTEADVARLDSTLEKCFAEKDNKLSFGVGQPSAEWTNANVFGETADKAFDPSFPFNDDVFLSTDPMTDEEFANYVGVPSEAYRFIDKIVDDIDTGEAPLEDESDAQGSPGYVEWEEPNELKAAIEFYVPVLPTVEPAIDITGESSYEGSPQTDFIDAKPSNAEIIEAAKKRLAQETIPSQLEHAVAEPTRMGRGPGDMLSF